jgi:vesicle-associated membrane protein 7
VKFFSIISDITEIFFFNQKHFSESRDIDTVSQVQGELDDLKDVMVKNIGKV